MLRKNSMRRMRPLSLLALTSSLFSFCALLCRTAALAQSAAPAVQIVAQIDENNLVTLRGDTHPAANARNDRGPVSPDLPMTDLIVVLSRDPAQQAAAERTRDAYAASLAAAGHGEITTEIAPAGPFYYAEEYHQQYLAKNPNGYCGLGGTGVSCPVGVAATPS